MIFHGAARLRPILERFYNRQNRLQIGMVRDGVLDNQCRILGYRGTRQGRGQGSGDVSFFVRSEMRLKSLEGMHGDSSAGRWQDGGRPLFTMSAFLEAIGTCGQSSGVIRYVRTPCKL